MKRVHVVDFDGWEGGDGPPEEAARWLAWFASKIGEIPAEFLPSARVEIGTTEAYGSSYPRIEIYYDRPYTVEEMTERADAERARRNADERREREVFEKLKRKFGE